MKERKFSVGLARVNRVASKIAASVYENEEEWISLHVCVRRNNDCKHRTVCSSFTCFNLLVLCLGASKQTNLTINGSANRLLIVIKLKLPFNSTKIITKTMKQTIRLIISTKNTLRRWTNCLLAQRKFTGLWDHQSTFCRNLFRWNHFIPSQWYQNLRTKFSSSVFHFHSWNCDNNNRNTCTNFIMDGTHPLRNLIRKKWNETWNSRYVNKFNLVQFFLST